jgi:D-glycero-D-manno-heptose 1,7-bisphosphate phosphatase
MVTNQPDVARGTADASDVKAINLLIAETLQLDGVLLCAHDDSDKCFCRKPAPGMLMEASTRWGIDLQRSVMVGDRWRDVEAGRRAGAYTVFIDHGYNEPRPTTQDLTVSCLLDAVPWILVRLSPNGQDTLS